MVGPFFVRLLTSIGNERGRERGAAHCDQHRRQFRGNDPHWVRADPVPAEFVDDVSDRGRADARVRGLLHRLARKKEPVAPVALVILLGSLLGYGGVRNDRLHHTKKFEQFYGNSNFGLLQVLEFGETRYYLNDYLTQNTYDPLNKKSTSLFTYMLHGLARAYATNVNDVLCIGLGIGIVPMEFARDGAKVDVVEINPAVVPVAKNWFGLEPDKLNITIADGREFLNRSQKKYDAIALDAFLGESSPSHLMTREAFTPMRRVLKPGGVLVINSFGNFDPGEDFFTASLYNTLTNVFANVRIHSDGGGNTMFVASDRSELAFVHAPTFDHVHSHIRSRVETSFKAVVEPRREVYGQRLEPSHGRVLTDDFNPVDFYDAPNRERIRRGLAMRMKDLVAQ
jgi:SAM-dependent methyltransferase